MDLNGALADAEIARHDLVGPTIGHEHEHLFLARRQRSVPTAQLITLIEQTPVVGIGGERTMDAVDQFLIAEGLLQEIECTMLDGFDGHRNIGMTADENHGDDRAAAIEFLLQIEAAHARHTHIEHETSGLIGLPVGQELLRRSERGRGQTRGFQQQTQLISHRIIVIDDEHHGLSIHTDLPGDTALQVRSRRHPLSVYDTKACHDALQRSIG